MRARLPVPGLSVPGLSVPGLSGRGLAGLSVRLGLAVLLGLAILIARPARADPPGMAEGVPLSPDQLEAMALGRTFAYAEQGHVWGRETYLPDRRVLWRAVDDDCKAGHWWAEGRAICFAYDDGTTNQCWQFLQTGAGLRAAFLGNPAAPLASLHEEADPVPCPGPAIGS